MTVEQSLRRLASFPQRFTMFHKAVSGIPVQDQKANKATATKDLRHLFLGFLKNLNEATCNSS